MTPVLRLGLAQHALAVLGAAVLGSTLITLALCIAMIVSMGGFGPGISWLVLLALAIWLAIFIMALPGAGIVLSLLWPLTRRMSLAAGTICVLACAALGVALSPFASRDGVSVVEVVVFAAMGSAIAAIYVLLARRMSRDRSEV